MGCGRVTWIRSRPITYLLRPRACVSTAPLRGRHRMEHNHSISNPHDPRIFGNGRVIRELVMDRMATLIPLSVCALQMGQHAFCNVDCRNRVPNHPRISASSWSPRTKPCTLVGRSSLRNFVLNVSGLLTESARKSRGFGRHKKMHVLLMLTVLILVVIHVEATVPFLILRSIFPGVIVGLAAFFALSIIIPLTVQIGRDRRRRTIGPRV